MGAAPVQSEFQIWFQEFISYAYPLANILFWLVIAVVAIWAVVLFKRLVDFKTGRLAAHTLTEEQDASASADEFVE